MEDAAVSLCKSVLDIVVGHARSMIADEVALQLGVQREVAIIADEFEMMRYFLMTNDKNQDPGWAKKVRDVAYDVEDGLELLAAKVDQLEEKPSRWRIPRVLCERRRATAEVKALLARVADVAFLSKTSLYSRLVKGADDDPATLAVAEQSDIFAAITAIDEARRAAAARLDESKVDLLQLIDDGDKELRVIVVWGTSCCLDKISAVKEVCGDVGNLNGKFGCRARVKLDCLSLSYREILVNMLSQFSAEVTGGTQHRNIKECAFVVLETMAATFLNKERFLIVIDDLCSISHWEWIKTYFPYSKKGSRIIVSTRQVEIASLCTERPYQVSKLTQLESEQSLYMFHHMVKPQADAAETISHLRTTARTDNFEVVGMHRERDDLISMICKEPQNHECMVISVCGMGGLGKTTLVRLVYKHPEIADLFHQNRAWITVQRPLSVASIIRIIAEQLYGRAIDTVGSGGLLDKITSILGTKRCLIVLDDLASISEWDSIIPFLEKAAVIIITTREYSLARHCSRAQNVYCINSMDEEDALDLLAKKAFKKHEGLPLSPEMIHEARLILKKCGGLPLAISLIGSFLFDKPITEWRNLNDLISSQLENDSDLQLISTDLYRIYDDLPYHLKSCLLYMAVFPEDHHITRKRLIRLWVAEGYSRAMKHMTAEEVGKKHFALLLGNSMIKPTTEVLHSTGKIYSCVLRHLIHKICISKSMEEEFILTLDDNSSSTTCEEDLPKDTNNQEKKEKIVRQLAIRTTWTRDKVEFERILDSSRVRSLIVFGEWRPFFISNSTKFLRVLDLEDASELTDHHLNDICGLLHLKYLSLRGCKDIFRMPESLGNLRQLRTLDIRGTNVFQLPSTFNKLRKLQHLHASAWFKEEEHKVGSSSVPDELATDRLKRRHKLKISCGYKDFNFLSHPESRVVQAPTGFGKLSALRTLGYVGIVHGKGNASVEELKELTQLCKLELQVVDRTNSREFWSAIAGHNHLRSLSVKWDSVAGELDCDLDGLSPPKFIENLKLWGRLVRVTQWVLQLQYLSKLQLHGSGLNQDAIEGMGGLPNLVVLRMWESSFIEEVLQFSKGSFPSLVLLELRELYVTTRVMFEERAMPKLEQLRVDHGWSRLHGFLGLQYLWTLKEILLDYDQFSDELMENVRRQKAMHPNYRLRVKLMSDRGSTLVRDLD